MSLTGSALGLRAAVPLMIPSGGGTIVNISSNIAFSRHVDVAETAGGWAPRGFTRSTAMDLSDRGIRVNSVCAGLSATEMNETSPHLPPRFRMVPTGRNGTPERMAKLVFFLTSDDSAFITGEGFGADDGFNVGASVRRIDRETADDR